MQPDSILRTVRPFLATLACTATLAATAAGQQTLLDQQPTQSFSQFAQAGSQSMADNFVVGGAVPVNLVTVRWWGTWNMFAAPVADTFNILIHDNAPGVPSDEPGAVIQSFLALLPTVTPTGNSFPTSVGVLPEFELEVTLPTTLALNPGTYWIEVYSTGSAGTPDTFVWEMAAQDPLAGAPCVAWSSSTPGVGWNSCTPFPASDMALVLEGNVPVPVTIQCDPANDHYQGNYAKLDDSSFGSGVGSGLHIDVKDGPVDEFGFMLVSDDGSVTLAVFNGVLCLGNPQGRYNPQIAVNQGLPQLNSIGQFDANGDLVNIVGTSSTGFGFDVPLELPYSPVGQLIAPGDTLYFQCWYRDQNAPFPNPGSSANFSNMIEVTFP